MSKLEEKLEAEYGDYLYDGIPISVTLYKEEDFNDLSVEISSGGSQTAKYHYIKNEDDIGKALTTYLENYL